MNENRLADNHPDITKTVTMVLEWLVWLVSAVLGILAIFAARDFVILGLGALLNRFSDMPGYQVAQIVNIANTCSMLILGIVALIVVIAGFEHTSRRIGDPRLLRTLLIIIGVECAIVVPAALLFWGT